MSEINLKLTKNEAIVLFDLLNRFSETDKLSIEYPSEQRVLWDLSCSLEIELSELFDPNYDDLLRLARETLT